MRVNAPSRITATGDEESSEFDTGEEPGGLGVFPKWPSPVGAGPVGWPTVEAEALAAGVCVSREGAAGTGVSVGSAIG